MIKSPDDGNFGSRLPGNLFCLFSPHPPHLIRLLKSKGLGYRGPQVMGLNQRLHQSFQFRVNLSGATRIYMPFPVEHRI